MRWGTNRPESNMEVACEIGVRGGISSGFGWESTSGRVEGTGAMAIFGQVKFGK